ncbi:MAG: Hpt domain-containing protein [Campylobacterota bacterium]|nr:Hpt domain-containing protein [Campylobacterota bacterium]
MEIDTNIFFDEFLNKLAQMENSLVDARTNLDNLEKINEIFRAIHTVKGVADLLCFFDIVHVAHKAEDLLGEIREGKVKFTIQICDLFIELKKFVKIIIEEKLNGYDIDEEQEKLFLLFEKEFLKYMAKSILIIDNSEFTKKFIEKVRLDIKHNIIIASTQQDAIDTIRSRQIGLVFSDFSTNTKDGLGTIIKLRGDSKYQELPIVIITNEKKEDLINIGKVTKAKAWLAKPFKEDQFKAIVDKFLPSTT